MEALNVIDIVIIAIMLIFGIAGFAKGFLASLVKLFGSVASLALAVWLATPVTNFINGFVDLTGWFGDKISSALIALGDPFGFVVGTGYPLDGAQTLTGTALKAAIDGVTAFNSVVKISLKFFIQDDVVLGTGTVVGEWLGTLLGGIAALVATAVAIYLAIRIAVAILSKIFDAITKNAAIGGLDRLLGLAFGAAKGALLISILLAGLVILSRIGIINDLITPLVDTSVIGKPWFDFIVENVQSYVDTVDWNAIIPGLISNIGF